MPLEPLTLVPTRSPTWDHSLNSNHGTQDTSLCNLMHPTGMLQHPLGFDSHIIERAFTNVCADGCQHLVDEYLMMYPQLGRKETMNLCLESASKGGNLRLVMHLLWDAEHQCESTEFELAHEVFGTMIVAAAKNERPRVLRFLLFILNERDEQQMRDCLQQAMEEAIINGALETFEIIMGNNRHGALLAPNLVFDGHENRIIKGIAATGRQDILEYLWKQRQESKDKSDRRFDSFEPHDLGNVALWVACKNNQVEFSKYLLGIQDTPSKAIFSTIDPSSADNECLNIACSEGHLAIVKLLFERNDDGTFRYPSVTLNSRGKNPLTSAIYNGHLDLVKFLLQGILDNDGIFHYALPGAAACLQNETIFLSAIERGRVEILLYLLQVDEVGNHIFIKQQLSNVVLRSMLELNSEKLMGLLLLNQLQHSKELIELGLKKALQHQNIQSTYRFVNAMHGPLPPLDTHAGYDRLFSILKAHKYLTESSLEAALANDYLQIPWSRQVSLKTRRSLRTTLHPLGALLLSMANSSLTFLFAFVGLVILYLLISRF